jgi:hypothetical protein
LVDLRIYRASFVLALLADIWMARKNPAQRQGVLFALAVMIVPLLGLLAMVYGVQALSGRHGGWSGSAVLALAPLVGLDRARLRWLAWGARC